MAKDRQTRVPETDPDAAIPSEWELDGDGFKLANPELIRDPAEREDAEDQLVRALYDAAVVLRRIGGIVSFAPVRVELAPDIFVTTEFAMRWNSYSPPSRPAQPEAVEAEPEPQAA